MAQLKDTLIQGSARVTDTLYANSINGLTLTAATTGFTVAGGTTSKTLTVADTVTLNAPTQWGIVYGGASGAYTSTAAGTSGQYLKSNGSAAPTWADLPASGVSLSSQSTSTIYLTGAASSSSTALELSSATITTDGYLTATRVYNAVWNDYAEYRQSRETQPGRCVQENDDGWLTRTQERLIPGASIISDTWGNIMGETEYAKVPIAIAGRVLAFPYRNRKAYHAGMTVCCAPNGTVDFMTRDEIMKYPDCIVGIVSEVPEYEYWGSGQVPINGRIWIKVK